MDSLALHTSLTMIVNMCVSIHVIDIILLLHFIIPVNSNTKAHLGGDLFTSLFYYISEHISIGFLEIIDRNILLKHSLFDSTKFWLIPKFLILLVLENP